MCCTIDKEYTAKTIARLEKLGLTMKAYKTIYKDGKAAVKAGYTYAPGLHKLPKRLTQEEYERSNHGFHFFLTKKDAERRLYSDRTVVEVEVPINDIIGLQHPNTEDRQGVANSLFISKKAWLEAGLEIKRVRKPKSVS